MNGERSANYLQDVFGSNSNLIDVHIKNIRRKIEEHQLPMSIVTMGHTGFRRLVMK